MTIETNAPATRIADLDALRGLAALAVVLFHYTDRFGDLYGHADAPLVTVPWGHYGVQLFFGISGFVIFMTLDRTHSLRDFAVSRASRLFPAYWTAILLTTLVVAFAGMEELAISPAQTAANLTMLQSFALIPSVDGVYWTLSVELAFYGAMAALWQMRLLARIEAVLIAWLALKWFWTFAPASFGIEPSWLLGTLAVQQHIPFFAIGIAAYRLRRGDGGGGRAAWAVIAAAIATVAACDDFAHLLVALVTAGALVSVARGGVPFLDAAPLVWLGSISYSLYLLHQYIGFALLVRLEAIGVDATLAILLTLAALLLLAACVTFWVERPALRLIRDRYRRRPDHPQPVAA